jgi:hypothetical protein
MTSLTAILTPPSKSRLRSRSLAFPRRMFRWKILVNLVQLRGITLMVIKEPGGIIISLFSRIMGFGKSWRIMVN